MKTKTKIGTIIAFASLLSISVKAQEPDTVKIIKETQIVHDTVFKQVQAPPPPQTNEPVAPPATERAPLRRGEFGVRYMPTFASLALKNSNGDVVQGELTMSHGYGLMLAGNLSKNVGIQAEISYLDISQKYKDRNLDRQVNVSYLNIPILLSLNTDKTRIVNLNFVAGPQFGVNLGSSIKTSGNEETETLRATVGASGSDIGAAYGTGLEIALNRMHTFRLDFGYRGFYGIVDGNADQSSKNPDTYNVLVKASRQTHAGYVGLTLCF
ncbi:MAG: PorT family protein [Burkholderiales bacterium]|nr:PorT family protein [Bacteroidia bacterium]